MTTISIILNAVLAVVAIACLVLAVFAVVALFYLAWRTIFPPRA